MKKILVKEFVVLPIGNSRSNDTVFFQHDCVNEIYRIGGVKVDKQVFYHFLQLAINNQRVLSITERLQVGLNF